MNPILDSVGRRIVPLTQAVGVTGRRVTTGVRHRLGWFAPLWARVAVPVLAPITAAGWTVLGFGTVCLLLGVRFGWNELLVVGCACLLVVALCAGFMIGRTRLNVSVSVEPRRVSVGEVIAGGVEVENRAKGVLLPVMLEVPIGAGIAQFPLPALRGGASHEELFVVPTHRRGVILVGPARTTRGDSLGLLRREVEWAEPLEVFIHPRTVRLEPLGAGFMRDLEGVTANQISPSDLAFHALREYVPGDDLRHIHWRSSAKAGQMLVRQFLDTRRTHVTAVVDNNIGSYADPGDYENAISVAASLVKRAFLDEFDASFMSGTHAMSAATANATLDTMSRADLGQETLVGVAARAVRLAPDTSLAVLITGAAASFHAVQRAVGLFASDVAVVVFVIDPSKRSGLSSAGGATRFNLNRLEDLPAVLTWGLR